MKMPHEYLFDFAQSKLKTETSLFTQKKKELPIIWIDLVILNRSNILELYLCFHRAKFVR